VTETIVTHHGEVLIWMIHETPGISHHPLHETTATLHDMALANESQIATCPHPPETTDTHRVVMTVTAILTATAGTVTEIADEMIGIVRVGLTGMTLKIATGLIVTLIKVAWMLSLP
jgi:hypothetical protein